MSDDPRNEPDARLADALSRLHAEVEPPPRVEDRLVARLAARGDIVEPPSLRPWLIAAGIAAVLLLGVLFLRRPEAVAPAGTDTIVAGGAFVDQGSTAVPTQQVIDALHAQTAPDGSPLYLDAFASYAVQFGRYC